MATLNKVFLLGNLTRDPDLKKIGENSQVCKFGLASNRKYKQQDKTVEETTFVDVDVFGKNAELCNQYLYKGRQVLVEGRLKYDKWESDGQKRSKLSVVAERVNFLGSKNNQQSNESPENESQDEEVLF